MVNSDDDREGGRLEHKGISSGGDTGDRNPGNLTPSTWARVFFQAERGPEYLGPSILLGGMRPKHRRPSFPLGGICVWAGVFPGWNLMGGQVSEPEFF